MSVTSAKAVLTLQFWRNRSRDFSLFYFILQKQFIVDQIYTMCTSFSDDLHTAL